jgi:hypothetical protein
MASWQMFEKMQLMVECCKFNLILWQFKTLIGLLSDKLLKEDFAML